MSPSRKCIIWTIETWLCSQKSQVIVLTFWPEVWQEIARVAPFLELEIQMEGPSRKFGNLLPRPYSWKANEFPRHTAECDRGGKEGLPNVCLWKCKFWTIDVHKNRSLCFDRKSKKSESSVWPEESRNSKRNVERSRIRFSKQTHCCQQWLFSYPEELLFWRKLCQEVIRTAWKGLLLMYEGPSRRSDT